MQANSTELMKPVKRQVAINTVSGLVVPQATCFVLIRIMVQGSNKLKSKRDKSSY